MENNLEIELLKDSIVECIISTFKFNYVEAVKLVDDFNIKEFLIKYKAWEDDIAYDFAIRILLDYERAKENEKIIHRISREIEI